MDLHSILKRSSTAHLALSLVFLGIALTLFSLIMYGVVKTRADAISSTRSFAGQLVLSRDLQRAAGIASVTRQEREALQGLVVQKWEEAAFIEYVESLGGKAHVSVDITSVESEPALEDALDHSGVLKLSVHIKGSYSACLRYLELIETMHAAVSVSTISLSYNSVEKTWGGTLSFTVISLDDL